MRDHFAPIVGIENALDNPNDLLAYSYDASGMEGKARLVLFPGNEEDVRQVLTYANRTNIPVVARGLGANPVGMVVPQNAIVLDMSRFDRIHTVNLKEGWILVDVGVVLSDIQILLAKHGYRFPISPQSKGVSTIGGLLAVNQMDRMSYKHGKLKQHVLQLELIDGTGKYYDEGNVDFIGMEGAGAIFLRAKIKIYPQATVGSTDILTFEEIHDLLATVDEKKQDFTVRSIEYLNPTIAKQLKLKDTHYLLIEYETEKGEYHGEPHERIWQQRESAWSVASAHDYPIIEDCQSNSENIYDIISWSTKHEVPMVGHIGQGIFHPFFSAPNPTQFYEFLSDIGADHAGQFGYGRLKRAYVNKRKKDLFIKLKDQYDYADIINRGVIHDFT